MGIKLSIINISFLIIVILLPTVYAASSLTIYHSDNTSYQKKYPCPDWENEVKGICYVEHSDLICGIEGQYSMNLCSEPGQCTGARSSYYVRYDSDQIFCENVKCGDGRWSTNADLCCGDDAGLSQRQWQLYINIDEKDIPSFDEEILTQAISMEYRGPIEQIVEKDFSIDRDHTEVTVEFRLNGCYLSDTEIYASIKDDAGNYVNMAGEDYIFRIAPEDPCIGSRYEKKHFTANKDHTYTLELHKSEFGGVIDLSTQYNFGFTDMSLVITYTDIIPINITKNHIFKTSLTSSGNYTIDMTAEQGGNLDRSTIEVGISPISYAMVNDYFLLDTVDGIQVEIDVKVYPDNGGDDCGLLESGDLCFDNTAIGSSSGMPAWGWLSARTSQYGIASIECMATSAVSDGADWHICDYSDAIGAPVIPIINKDYFCYSDNNVSLDIAECCGEQQSDCMSLIQGRDYGGIRKLVGASINHSIGRHYCTNYGRWVTDLDYINSDDPNGVTCTNAGFPDGTAENLLWTGNHCCGEADDIEEFYNDAGGDGACWNNTGIENKNYVEQNGLRLHEVIAFNGSFYGCAIDATRVYPENQYLLSIQDRIYGGSVVQNLPFCTVIEDGFRNRHAYCTYDEEWVGTSDLEIKKSEVPSEIVDVPVRLACCAFDQCWSGDRCIDDQSDSDDLQTYFEKYRCINGTWEEAVLKNNYENMEIGFCPRSDQCLVTQGGEYESNDQPDKFYTSDEPKCVTEGDYFLDFYCENGEWTSRTKQIATAMIYEMEKRNIDDYTLYCDDYSNVLPRYQDLIPDCSREGNPVDCINNVCLLTYDDEIIIGTSFNVPIDTIELEGFLPAFSNCRDDMASTGKFTACDATNMIWYNHDIESIIFDKYRFEAIDQQNIGWLVNSMALIKGKILNILEKIDLWQPTGFGDTKLRTDFLEGITHFDKIYIQKAGDKSISATNGHAVMSIGSPPRSMNDVRKGRFIAVEYENFEGLDICKYVENYNTWFSNTNVRTSAYLETLACNQDNDKYYLFSEDPIPDEVGGTKNVYMGDEIWQDLTSKLRINRTIARDCSDECSLLGQKQCSGEDYIMCGDFDTDACYEWSSAMEMDCEDYCINGIRYYDGRCTGSGVCGYSHEICEHGCIDNKRCRLGDIETDIENDIENGSSYETIVALNCRDTSTPAGWYKQYGGRCGEQAGLDYWNNQIFTRVTNGEESISDVFASFIAAYTNDCQNMFGISNYAICNDMALCHSGDDYVANTNYCIG